MTAISNTSSIHEIVAFLDNKYDNDTAYSLAELRTALEITEVGDLTEEILEIYSIDAELGLFYMSLLGLENIGINDTLIIGMISSKTGHVDALALTEAYYNPPSDLYWGTSSIDSLETTLNRTPYPAIGGLSEKDNVKLALQFIDLYNKNALLGMVYLSELAKTKPDLVAVLIENSNALAAADKDLLLFALNHPATVALYSTISKSATYLSWTDFTTALGVTNPALITTAILNLYQIDSDSGLYYLGLLGANNTDCGQVIANSGFSEDLIDLFLAAYEHPEAVSAYFQIRNSYVTDYLDLDDLEVLKTEDGDFDATELTEALLAIYVLDNDMGLHYFAALGLEFTDENVITNIIDGSDLTAAQKEAITNAYTISTSDLYWPEGITVEDFKAHILAQDETPSIADLVEDGYLSSDIDIQTRQLLDLYRMDATWGAYYLSALGMIDPNNAIVLNRIENSGFSSSIQSSLVSAYTNPGESFYWTGTNSASNVVIYIDSYMSARDEDGELVNDEYPSLEELQEAGYLSEDPIILARQLIGMYELGDKLSLYYLAQLSEKSADVTKVINSVARTPVQRSELLYALNNPATAKLFKEILLYKELNGKYASISELSAYLVSKYPTETLLKISDAAALAQRILNICHLDKSIGLRSMAGLGEHNLIWVAGVDGADGSYNKTAAWQPAYDAIVADTTFSESDKAMFLDAYINPNGAYGSTWKMVEQVLAKFGSISDSLKAGLSAYTDAVNNMTKPITDFKTALSNLNSSGTSGNTYPAVSDVLRFVKELDALKAAHIEFKAAYDKYAAVETSNAAIFDSEIAGKWSTFCDNIGELLSSVEESDVYSRNTNVAYNLNTTTSVSGHTGFVTGTGVTDTKDYYIPMSTLLEIARAVIDGTTVDKKTFTVFRKNTAGVYSQETLILSNAPVTWYNDTTVDRSAIASLATTSSFSSSYEFILMQTFGSLGAAAKDTATQNTEYNIYGALLDGKTTSGTDVASKGATSIISSLSSAATDNNSKLSSKGQSLNSIYDQIKELINVMTDFYKSMVRNQVA